MVKQWAVILLGMAVIGFAQVTSAQSNDDSASSTVTAKTLLPVKQGRAPRIEDLNQIRLATPPVQIPLRGAINPLRLPLHLENIASGFNSGDPDNIGTEVRAFELMANAPAVSLSIPGYSSDDNAAVIGGRITPPDTNGDVGVTHYVQYINLGWVFFDKATGAVAGGPFAGNTFWAGFGGICEQQNAGDPIVLYDHIAGRWFFSQFTGTTDPDGHQCIAISDGEDPAGPYTLFDFNVSPGGFNDYPKIGLWPDGYYMTTHEFAGTPLAFQGVNLTVFDRVALLSGTAGAVQFSPTSLDFGSLAANLEGPDLPPAGTCNYLVHGTDGAAFGGTDRYQFWEACIDFTTPANSTLTQLPDLPTTPFDVNLCGFGRDCIFQPSAQRLDPLAAFTVYRFNNRYFPAEGLLRSAVTNNVDVGGDRAGVRWAGFEINPVTNAIAVGDGGDLLGTVDFADGLSRWAGSASVDASGNIGIGYTRSGSTSFPSIYFTVHERGVDAPGGVQAESVCVDGTGTHEGANRWADYASTSVDPVDGCTFWHTNEYVETTGNFQWDTRVCSFTIPSCVGGFVDVVLAQTIPANIDEPGGSVTVDMVLTNNEAGAIELTALTHNLLGDLNAQGSCAVPQTIASGGNYSCSFNLNVTGNAGDSVSSVITATGDQLGLPFTANDSDTLAITDVLPTVTVSKTATPDNVDAPGGDVSFSTTVQNTSIETLTLTSLVDDIHGDLDGQGTCSVPQVIAANDSYSCSFMINVTGNGGDVETDTITATIGDDDGNSAQGQASATVTINAVAPTIIVSKSASPDNVDEPGGNVVFSTQVQNTSLESLTLNSLVDDIHGDLNGQGTCSVPQTIAVSSSYSCTFTINVTGNAGDTETDTITAMASDSGGGNAQGQASATVTINGVAPNITVSKLATPDNVDEPGGDVVFSTEVQNTGVESLTLTSLVDDVHGDLNGQGTCSVPQTIAVSSSYSCNFTAAVNGNAGDSETDTITATVEDDESNSVQGQASATVTINDAQPSINVSKQATPDNIDEPGANVTFSAQVQNAGVESLTLTSLVDNIHGDLNGQGTCSLPQTMAISGSYSCNFTAAVNGNAGDTETDTITATVEDDEANSVQGQASATVTINDVAPTIVVSKLATPDNVDEPGGSVGFSVGVQNTSVENITLTTLIDDIHGDLNGQGNCSVPQTIVAGRSYICAFTVTVNGNAGDSETDTITATVTDDDSNTLQGQASATVNINDVLPTISVSKSASPDNVDEPGGDVTFSVQVQSTSIESLTLNSLVDDIHGDLNGQGTCSVPQTIAVNASYGCSFTVSVTGNAGDTETDTITATVSDDDGNNAQGQASATVTINGIEPTITVSKSASPDNVDEPGGNVTFSAQVLNTGVEAITLTSLVDNIHGDLNGQGNCSVPQPIAISASYNCSFSANVTGNAGDTETDTITAIVSDDDGDTAQGQASATVTINGVAPTITVSKSASPDNVDEPGGDVVFSTQIQNTGVEVLTLTSLVDNIHGDLNGQGSCSVPQTIAINSAYSCSFTVNVTGNAGDSETDTITATVSDDDGNNVQGQASATVTINAVAPTITVTKAASPDNVNEPGAAVSFSTSVQNTSVEVITLNSLVDDIHGDLNGQGTCSVPQTIATAGTYSCNFTANVTGNAGDSETDTITATVSDDDGSNAQGQASAIVTINDVLPSITASKSATPDNVNEPGGAVTFTTEVNNTSIETVTLTSLIDDIHGDLNGQGDCSVPQNIVANGTYACSFTAMVVGVGGDVEVDTITAIANDDENNPVQAQASATVTINNIDTVINAPGNISGLEDNGLTLTGISVSDPGAVEVFTSLAVNNGLLTLNGAVGLNFTNGDGTNDAAMTFSGSVAATNQALDGATYQPDADFNGIDILSIQADDETLTRLASSTVDLNIGAVNDEPSFTVGPNQTVSNDAGAQTITPWATGISAGPSELAQTVSFEVTSVSNAGLFSSQPLVDASGALSFAPQAAASGIATVNVRIMDDGGVANGGDDQSDEQSFTIEVVLANSADLMISKGNGMSGADENQTFDYTIVVSNAGPNDVVGATVTDNLPANLINPIWICTPSAGAVCTLNGTGNINDVVTIPVDGNVTYLLTVTVAEPEGGNISNTASVTSPIELPDPNTRNNTSTDSDTVGLFVDGFESE